jgi:hypothetical protein
MKKDEWINNEEESNKTVTKKHQPYISQATYSLVIYLYALAY